MKVINCNMSTLSFNELRDFMQRMVYESLVSLDGLSDKEAHVKWYETCSMDDYFTEWDHIWDDDENLIGEGLDTISSKFILNDNTRADFEKAFSQARNAALDEYKENVGE